MKEPSVDSFPESSFNEDSIFSRREEAARLHLASLGNHEIETAVDLGCGLGSSSIILAKSGTAVVAIDIDLTGKNLDYALKQTEREVTFKDQ